MLQNVDMCPKLKQKKAEEFVYMDLKVNSPDLAQMMAGNKSLDMLENGDKVKVSLTVDTGFGKAKTMEFDAVFYKEGGRGFTKESYTFKIEKDLDAKEVTHINEFMAQFGKQASAVKIVSKDKLPGGGAKVHKG